MDNMNGSKPANVSVDVAELMKGFKPASGSVSYATSINILMAGNDYLLVFHRPRPGTTDHGLAPFAVMEIGELIGISVKTAKDLHHALTAHLNAYESVYGKVETEYTRRMEGAVPPQSQ
jgi:hypothetical protein